jgi:hypothetical protein
MGRGAKALMGGLMVSWVWVVSGILVDEAVSPSRCFFR